MSYRNRYRRRPRWIRHPLIWLGVGILIGVVLEEFVPGPIDDWIDDKRDSIVSGTSTAVSVTSTTGDELQPEVNVGPRPDWCPRWAAWELKEVPRYDVETPTCDADEFKSYVGYWVLPMCFQTEPMVGPQFQGEGIVYTGDGTPDSRYYTTCY